MRSVARSGGTCVLLLQLTLLAACSERLSPTAVRPSPSTLLAAAVPVKGEGVLRGNGATDLDCIGEVGLFHSELPYRFQSVVTPSGNTEYHDAFIPSEGTGTIIGQTTGRVWTLERAVSPEVIQTNAAGERSFFTTNNWYVSETGPRLNFHNTFQFRQNADGEIVVESLEVRCITH